LPREISYKNPIKSYTKEDENAIHQALNATKTYDLHDCEVQNLSGGQRQRVWIVMTLAQDTDIIFFDHPTTYLDLLIKLNEERGKTIAMVLHDLNLAARYADLLSGYS